MEAVSSMVEEMFEEAKMRYKVEAEKAVELAKMAADIEKEHFKLEYKRSSDVSIAISFLGYMLYIVIVWSELGIN